MFTPITLDELEGSHCSGEVIPYGFPQDRYCEECGDASCEHRAGVVQFSEWHDPLNTVAAFRDKPFWYTGIPEPLNYSDVPLEPARVRAACPRPDDLTCRAWLKRVASDGADPAQAYHRYAYSHSAGPWPMHPLDWGDPDDTWAHYALLRIIHETPDWQEGDVPPVYACREYPHVMAVEGVHLYGLFPRLRPEPLATLVRDKSATTGIRPAVNTIEARLRSYTTDQPASQNLMAIAKRRLRERVAAWTRYDPAETLRRLTLLVNMLPTQPRRRCREQGATPWETRPTEAARPQPHDIGGYPWADAVINHYSSKYLKQEDFHFLKLNRHDNPYE